MAVDAMKSGNIAVNPRASRQCDIEMLYRRALGYMEKIRKRLEQIIRSCIPVVSSEL